MLLLPHHHEFAETLANLPFFYKQMARETCETLHLIQKNPNHLAETATTAQLQEYLLGGEIDQYIEFVDGYAENDVDNFEEDGYFPEWELSNEWIGSI